MVTMYAYKTKQERTGMDVMVVGIGDDDITRFCDVLNKSLDLLCELTNDQAHLVRASALQGALTVCRHLVR